MNPFKMNLPYATREQAEKINRFVFSWYCIIGACAFAAGVIVQKYF